MKKRQLRKTLEWVVVLTVIISLALIVRVYAIEPRQVRMSSMFPTLSDGDYILVNRMAYLFSGPERGDIVVFEPPYTGKDDYIKRVVGLPGEKVAYKNGEIWVNGERIVETKNHILSQSSSEPSRKNTPETNEGELLGEDEYYVIGDNRSHSLDSRAFGAVSKSDILGKAFIIFLPPKHFKFIP